MNANYFFLYKQHTCERRYSKQYIVEKLTNKNSFSSLFMQITLLQSCCSYHDNLHSSLSFVHGSCPDEKKSNSRTFQGPHLRYSIRTALTQSSIVIITSTQVQFTFDDFTRNVRLSSTNVKTGVVRNKLPNASDE